MSSDLSVHLHRPISLKDLLREAPSAIDEVLDIKAELLMTVFQADNGRWHQIEDADLSCDGQVIAMKFVGADEAVGISLIELPSIPAIPIEGQGLWAEIYVSAMRTPLEFAMAAGIAIAIARLTDASVIDDATEWNPIFEQSAEDFMRAVQAHGPFEHLDNAAEEFYKQKKRYRSVR